MKVVDIGTNRMRTLCFTIEKNMNCTSDDYGSFHMTIILKRKYSENIICAVLQLNNSNTVAIYITITT